ncbi:flagellar basal body rod protein FlgC [Geomicrobium sp. JCM 19038]|uniref:flagellar basal body rod protein FlgC n=1 Tax=Geomicrobium sp. JCM 19038 TaxID=1460635 RepID=UPI00045F30CE|nr:flagellar basal body rod protein FlgC [Geomicrobium sp. JCM 19038]GAK07522.1 flagellar basal-body rod protein FlgC [Geomicrobium sp. JCM 19038]
MSLFTGMNATSSALTAQRLRMDVAASNMANAETTRATMVDGEWQPYERKVVTLSPNKNESFASILSEQRNQSVSNADGVKVTSITADQTPGKTIYQPGHPDADEAGNLHMPNVDPLKEMVDIMGATRSYEANVTVFDAHKSMMMKALEIGRG